MTRDNFWERQAWILKSTENGSLERRKQQHELHENFYLQFATPATKLAAEQMLLYHDAITANKIDGALNSIPLELWDKTPMSMNSSAFKEAHRLMSPAKADRVCVLKATAKQVLKDKGWTEQWEKNPKGWWDLILVNPSGTHELKGFKL